MDGDKNRIQQAVTGYLIQYVSNTQRLPRKRAFVRIDLYFVEVMLIVTRLRDVCTVRWREPIFQMIPNAIWDQESTVTVQIVLSCIWQL